MYTSLIVLMIGIALILGSWLGIMLPAALIGILLVHTDIVAEDRMLKAELAGYRGSANRVHARLLPGLW